MILDAVGLLHAPRRAGLDDAEGPTRAAVKRLWIGREMIAAAVNAVAERALRRVDVAGVHGVADQVQACSGALLLLGDPPVRAAVKGLHLAVDAVPIAVE